MRVSVTRLAKVTGAGTPALAMLLASMPALAQAAGDPGVARLSILAGEVDVRRADSGDTFAAALNAPISPGDYLTTLDDSRAEVEFNYGAALRVAQDTQLRFTRLDPQDHQLQLAQGTVELRVFRGLGSHPEIDTPAATIHPDERGSYRIAVTEDGNTEVTVRAGQADVTVGSGTQTIGPGSTLSIAGTGDAVQFQTLAAVPLDAFDSFNDDRDAFILRAHDSAYVDNGMLGADDLDEYGHWTDVPTYGQVWVPNDEAPGWAPYHNGNWVWQPYYGWTWVGYEPWGWAPYHYGNWFYAAGTGWAWYPGAYAVVQPYVYRPALVAFFSFGAGGGGLGIGFGNVGWVPVAPFEPFHPWWGFGGWGGNTIVNNTTIVNNYGNTYVNNGNITKIYSNASAPGGAVAVTNGSFSNGNFQHIQPVSSQQLQNVQPVRGVVPIVPTTHNLAFNPHQPAPLSTTPVTPSKFANFAAPPSPPKPFVAQRAAVAATAQSAYPEHATLFAKQAQTVHPVSSPDAPNESRPQPATEPASVPGSKPAYVPEGGASSPWDRFNAPSSGTDAKPPADVAPKSDAPQQYVAPKAYGAPKSDAAPKTYAAPKASVGPKAYVAPKAAGARPHGSTNASKPKAKEKS